MTSVLNNDDLLCEILLRPASPVGLVHATLVCKLWLSIISNPAFLRLFRKLYRPLLGFYLKRWTVPSVKFVSMPCIQELDSMIVHAGSAFDGSDMCQILYNSRNGRLLGSFHGRNDMLSPLNLEGNIVLVPPLWIDPIFCIESLTLPSLAYTWLLSAVLFCLCIHIWHVHII